MKTLYFIRHGKASWENMSQPDAQRPLLEKGISRTRRIAEFLLDKHVLPDLIISSHAVRAYETAKILAAGLKYPEDKIRIEEEVYFNGLKAMEDIIHSLDDSLNEVMLVGHNPDMTNFVNLFLTHKLDYLPTTGVVCVKFKTTQWNQVFMAEKEIPFIITPKTL